MIIDALPELISDQVELNIVGPTPNQNYLESLKEKIKSQDKNEKFPDMNFTTYKKLLKEIS